MELVIDISEEQYALIRSRIALIREEMRKKGYCNDDIVPVGWVAITDGTILPEGHGDLIDRDKLSPQTYEAKAVWGAVLEAPPIIKADKENKNGANN